MKIKIILKSPDAVNDSVRSAVEDQYRNEHNKHDEYLDDDEWVEINERVNALFNGPLHKWIAYREYVTIEIDTDAGTARVCEQG